MTSHPDDDSLGEEAPSPGVVLHLRGCPRCRVQRRILAAYTEVPAPPSEPGGMSEIAEALEALEQASASVALSTRFEVQTLLGAGTRGPVYAAHDRERERGVALKVARGADAAHQRRLLEVVRRAAHRHVARLVHVQEEGEVLHVARERCNGLELEVAWAGATRARIIEELIQLASALQMLHGAGVAHGGVQPGNLRVVGTRLVVMDPGFGCVPGAYAAPELAAGDATAAGDWYAFGRLLERLAPQLLDDDATRSSLSGLTARLVGADPVRRPGGGDVLGVLVVHRGETSSRYVERGRIGAGGMGEVVRVMDRSLDREVALKRMHERHAGRGDLMARFLREARVTAQLQHPGVVPVHELARAADGTPYYTMRAVGGRTLAEVLATRGPAWTLHRLVGVFHRACEALAYAHGHGFIHRDLKPSNIMVGDFGEVQVLDWGLAKRLDDAEGVMPADVRPDEEDGRTRMGQAAGTLGYMPVEQVTGQVHLQGPHTDVFALGVILYEILTEQPPFPGRETTEVARRTRQADYPPVRSVAPQAPRELAAVVERALRPALEDRYPDAGHLAADIEAWLGGLRVGAYPYSRVELLARALRPYQAPIAVAIVAVGLLGVAAGAWVVATGDRDRNQAQMLVERARRELMVGDRVRAETLAAEALRIHERPDARGILARVGRAWYPHRADLPEISCPHLAVTGPPTRLLCGGPDGVIGVDDAGSVAWSHPGAVRALGAGAGRVAVARSHGLQVLDAARGDVLWGVDDAADAVAVDGKGGVVWLSGGEIRGLEGPAPLAETPRVLVACGDEVLVRTDNRWVSLSHMHALVGIPAVNVAAAACDPDGARLAVADGQEIRIWDLGTSMEVARLAGHEDRVYALAWSRDGERVGSLADDGTLRLWDPADPASPELARLPGHRDAIALGFATDQPLIAVAGSQLRGWRTDGPASVAEIDAVAALRQVAWTGTGHLVTLDRNGVLKLWDPLTGRMAARQMRPTRFQSLAACAGEAAVIAGASDGSLFAVDPTGPTELWRVVAHEGPVEAVSCAPGAGLLASGGEDGAVRLWSLETGGEVGVWRTGGPAVQGLQLALDGATLLVHSVRGVDVLTGPGAALPNAETSVSTASFDPTFSRLAIGDDSGRVQVDGVDVSAHAMAVLDLAWSPGGRLLATAGQDQLVRVIEAVDGLGWRGRTLRTAERGRLDAHERAVVAVAFSPDGSMLATAGADGRVILWDVGPLVQPSASLAEAVAIRYGSAGRTPLSGGEP